MLVPGFVFRFGKDRQRPAARPLPPLTPAQRVDLGLDAGAPAIDSLYDREALARFNVERLR